MDVKLLWTVTTSKRMLQNHVYEYEKLFNYRLKACTAKWGRHFEQSTTILDLKGVNLSSFSSVYSLVTEVSSIGQNYYPEMLGRMFISTALPNHSQVILYINLSAPMLFTAIWTVIKQLLDEVTVKKIFILGSNYKKQLLESIDADQLPDFLGGDCKCVGGCADAGTKYFKRRRWPLE